MTTHPTADLPAQELQRAALLGSALLLVGCTVLGVLLHWALATRWLLQSALLWGLVWQQCRRRLPLNRATLEDPPYPDLGLANRLTLLRGGLIAATGGFLFQTIPAPWTVEWTAWLAAALYSGAAILDRVDGFVARRSQRTSLLGSELDTVYDALGLLIAPLLAVTLGKVHVSYLLVSVAYYLFTWGVYWRRRHGRPVHELLPNTLRRTLAGFQMGLVAVALWPPFQAPLTSIASLAFMVPVLAGFLVDWYVVSGRLPTDTPATAQFFERLATFSHNFLQPALRLLAVLLTVALLSGSTPSSAVQTSGFLCGLALMALGLGARLGALLNLVLLALLHPVGDSGILTGLVVNVTVWILLLGSGRFSLWQRDDHWVQRHDGAP